MAKKCFPLLVLFLFIFKNVCANYCNANLGFYQVSNCDECLRCSGNWCKKTEEINHCYASMADDWCDDSEEYPRIDPTAINGRTFFPAFAEETIFPGEPHKTRIKQIVSNANTTHDLNKPEIFIRVINSTQNLQVHLSHHMLCDKEECIIIVEAMPTLDFCLINGTTSEYFYVRLSLEHSDEEAIIKFHVPCACHCSKNAEPKSPICSKNGDLVCGKCNCYESWTGHFCQEPICDNKRGDIYGQCINPLKSGMNCSGNGYCGPCETCICHNDGIGSQYFDSNRHCADICMDISECETCLRNYTVGQSCDCHQSNKIAFVEYNETIAAEVYHQNRPIWVPCTETIETDDDKCHIEYKAMRYNDGHDIVSKVMIVEHCNQRKGGAVIMNATNVPIIASVIALIACIAGVGGFMLWKHMNAIPPLPLNDLQYQNIDAEDCIGENPLYKPPTSSFKNPTYGKW